MSGNLKKHIKQQKNMTVVTKQRSASGINKFEQRPEKMKFQSSMVVKPKKVNVTTRAQMDARFAKRKEKQKQKKQR